MIPDQKQPTSWKVSKFGDAAFALIILMSLVIVYSPSLRGGFLWDDDCWTTNIITLLQDLSGMAKFWLQPTALQQYYPLTATSFWIDYNLWGLWTTPYHLENVILHGISAWLFWRLLRYLDVPGSWFAAMIFALHPLMVESVAWITERKNVLSLVLYLGALIAYGRFCHFWSVRDPLHSTGEYADRHPRFAYLLALLLFLGAMLSKATAFSLPPVLLLICWWKRGRIRWREDVVPTLPIFAIAIGFSFVTAYLEKNHVGAHGTDWDFSFPQRFLVAGRVLWFYTAKLFWPSEFAFVYPRWNPDPTVAWQWLYPIGALCIIFGLIAASNRIGRGSAAAVLFFVGTLFPVLGFMNAYFMRYSFVSDHWAYLSSLSLIALAGALAANGAERINNRVLRLLIPCALLLLLAKLTWSRAHVYLDSESLWRDTIRKNPDSWMPHVNMSKLLVEKGKFDEAEAESRTSLRLRPNDVHLLYNFANLLARRGKIDEAIKYYRQALQLHPTEADVHFNLATLLFKQRILDESAFHFREAVRYKPDYPNAHYRLGMALSAQGRREEALRAFGEALSRNPGSAEIKAALYKLLAENYGFEGRSQ